MMTPPSIQVFASPDETAWKAAQFWVAAANRSIAARGAFHVALSGGSTPKALFAQLALAPLRNQLDWSRVWIYFGDERCVAQDHSDSNFRMAKESFLDSLPMNAEQIFPMFDPDKSPEVNAANYSHQLQALQKNASSIPQLDLIMLGMGPDGHTASLFPDTSILQEQDKIVAAVYVPKLNAWRISFTFPLLNAARDILFLATGKSKQEMLRQIFNQTKTQPLLPIEMLQPEGTLHWFIDAEANPT